MAQSRNNIALCHFLYKGCCMENYFQSRHIKWSFCMVIIISVGLVVLGNRNNSNQPNELLTTIYFAGCFSVTNLNIYQKLLLGYFSKKNSMTEVKISPKLMSILSIITYMLIIIVVFFNNHVLELDGLLMIAPLLISRYFGHVVYIGDKFLISHINTFNIANIREVQIRKSIFGAFKVHIVDDISRFPNGTITVHKKYIKNYIGAMKKTELDVNTEF